jgi:hypothetical protein
MCLFFLIIVRFIITIFKISFNRYPDIVINEVLQARENLYFVIVKIVICLHGSLNLKNFNFNLTSNYFAYFFMYKSIVPFDIIFYIFSGKIYKKNIKITNIK